LEKGPIMRLPRSCRPEPFCRGRQYISKYLVGFGMVAALMALCMGWLVHDAAAQINDAPDDGTLTVRKCLSKANTSVGPVGQTLIEEGIIEKYLLPTKVTNDMCENILDRTPDGTSVQTLVAAQNYIQEVNLIENSIRGAAVEAAARGTDRHLFGHESLISARVMAQADKSPAQIQYPDDETPSGGGSDETGVKPIRREAATVSVAAASTVANSNASIAGMLKEIEAAALKEGLSQSDAARGARCGLEQALLNAISKELSQRNYIKVSPEPTPKEMEYGETITIKLLVSGEVRGLYERLGGQYEKVAKASEAEEGCVDFTESMSADLLDRSFAVEPHQGQAPRPITHDTTWSWDVTANAEDKNTVDLLVGHVLQRGEMELTPHWLQPSPVRRVTITVKVHPLGEESSFVYRNWQWFLPTGIALAAAWLVWVFRKRDQQRPSEPPDEG
jgi:hypothetical protein